MKFVYSADLWNEVYSRISTKIQESKIIPNPLITPEIEQMIGTSPPVLRQMPSQEIQNQLASRALDIGMCGYLITLERLQIFDYVQPFYFASGFQAVVVRPTQLPSVIEVLVLLAGCIESKAQLILLVMLLFVAFFGHGLVALERLFRVRDSNFRKGYFESTQDGMWFAVIVLSSVGLGDLVPRSFAGRLLTVAWIFLSLGYTTMLLGAITNNFLQLQFIPDDPRFKITGLESLGSFSIVTAVSLAQSVVVRTLPSANLTKFPTNSQPSVFRALLSGAFAVAVDRPEVIQYYANFNSNFQGQLMPIGDVFSQEGVALAISRPAPNQRHPLHRLLCVTVSEILQGGEAWSMHARLRWFGPQPAASDSDPDVLRLELEERAVGNALSASVRALALLAGLWLAAAAAVCAGRLPAHSARNEVCAAVRRTVQVGRREAAPSSRHAVAYHALKSRVIAGLARMPGLHKRTAANGAQFDCDFEAVAKGSDGGDVAGDGDEDVVDEVAAGWILRAGDLADAIFGELATRLASVPGWWRRLLLRTGGRHFGDDGRALVWRLLVVSHEAAQAVLDDCEPLTEDTRLNLDDAADVLLELLAAEQVSSKRP